MGENLSNEGCWDLCISVLIEKKECSARSWSVFLYPSENILDGGTEVSMQYVDRATDCVLVAFLAQDLTQMSECFFVFVDEDELNIEKDGFRPVLVDPN